MLSRLSLAVSLSVCVCSTVWARPAVAGVTAGSEGNEVSVDVSTPSVTSGKAHTEARGPSRGPHRVCTYTLMTAVDAPAPPSSPHGQWFSVSCLGEELNPFDGGVVFVADIARAPALDSAVTSTAASEAADSISLPQPAIRMNPNSFSVVNLPTWLWIDPEFWHAFTASATAGGVTATATANPESVTWDMGDGHVVVCDGPGTPYQLNIPAAAQQTTCSYTYSDSSIGRTASDGDPNDAAYSITATVTWAVTWNATGASGGGVLPSLQTRTTVPVRVEQVESIGTVQ